MPEDLTASAAVKVELVEETLPIPTVQRAYLETPEGLKAEEVGKASLVWQYLKAAGNLRAWEVVMNLVEEAQSAVSQVGRSLSFQARRATSSALSSPNFFIARARRRMTKPAALKPPGGKPRSESTLLQVDIRISPPQSQARCS